MQESGRRKWLFWGMLGLMLYGSIEGMAWIGLRILNNVHHIVYAPMNVLSDEHREILERFLQGESNYLTHSPVLGWTLKPNGSTDLYQANSQGLRGNTDYQEFSPENILRIASFGDSFTHSSDVKNRDTWQEHLNRLTRDMEMLNFGVPAYGTDQAFLRYLHDGTQYHPQIVLIGFMPENIFRHVSVFRPFYARTTQVPLAKPRFILEQHTLTLFPNPMDELSRYKELLRRPEAMLAEMGTRDYYYQRNYEKGGGDRFSSVRLVKIAQQQFLKQHDVLVDGYYNEESEAFRVTVGIFDKFYHEVIIHGALPIILIFPERGDVYRYWQEGTRRYAPLLSYLDQKGYEYLDLINAFDGFKERKRFLLVKDTMRQLRNKDIPEEVVRDLKLLKHQTFESQDEFLAAVEMQIGKEAKLKYQGQIVEIAKIDEVRTLVPSHCSPLGNELIARYILQYLQEYELLSITNATNNVEKLKHSEFGE